jgi:hypothetical protein
VDVWGQIVWRDISFSRSSSVTDLTTTETAIETVSNLHVSLLLQPHLEREREREGRDTTNFLKLCKLKHWYPLSEGYCYASLTDFSHPTCKCMGTMLDSLSVGYCTTLLNLQLIPKYSLL